MNDSLQWLGWAAELQSLAQAGLAYSEDPYDLERFERIRAISAEMVAHMSDIPVNKVRELFCEESGYQTPKIDTRAAVFKDNKILLVRENDGLWSLPGGWADVGISAAENAAKEVREEAGLEVEVERLIAVQDRAKHNRPVLAHSVYKLFFLCKVLGGSFRANIETTESAYFSEGSLPPLRESKNTAEQIEMCFAAYRDPNWRARFD